MHISRSVFFAAMTGVAGVFGLAGVARAAPTPFFQHQGATDPTTEGWTKKQSGTTDLTVGAVTNDTGGYDAWKVSDQNSGGTIYYEETLTPQETLDVTSAGWTMRARVRVPNVSDTPDFSTSYFFDDGEADRRWGLNFGRHSSGATHVTLHGGGGALISGDGYHLIELVYDPETETASLWVDGEEEYTGYAGAGATLPSTLLRWGGLGNSSIGEANFNLVEFEVVPEPATMGLSALGVLTLLSARHRKTR